VGRTDKKSNEISGESPEPDCFILIDFWTLRRNAADRLALAKGWLAQLGSISLGAFTFLGTKIN